MRVHGWLSPTSVDLQAISWVFLIAIACLPAAGDELHPPSQFTQIESSEWLTVSGLTVGTISSDPTTQTWWNYDGSPGELDVKSPFNDRKVFRALKDKLVQMPGPRRVAFRQLVLMEHAYPDVNLGQFSWISPEPIYMEARYVPYKVPAGNGRPTRVLFLAFILDEKHKEVDFTFNIPMAAAPPASPWKSITAPKDPKAHFAFAYEPVKLTAVQAADDVHVLISGDCDSDLARLIGIRSDAPIVHPDLVAVESLRGRIQTRFVFKNQTQADFQDFDFQTRPVYRARYRRVSMVSGWMTAATHDSEAVNFNPVKAGATTALRR